MTEIIEALLASPAFRTLIEGIALKIVGEVLHRRAVDPNFVTSSNAAFAGLKAAKTSEELIAAQKVVQALIASS